MSKESKTEDKPLRLKKEDLESVEKLMALQFTDSERESILKRLDERRYNYERMRSHTIDNSIFPAIQFNPLTPINEQNKHRSKIRKPIKYTKIRNIKLPSKQKDIAFLPVTHLSSLIKTKKISSVQLTDIYIRRLKRYDPYLKCVVTLTEELAFKQAKRADEEISNGKYRGPLHGIPWGAKDLLSVKGYPTTWGAEPYRNQVIDVNSTVFKRLDDAGAVLVAKLSMGALAMGDYWFGGQTKNPWNLEQGSSGSSAGPGATVSGGLVGFAIGTETLGSIISPSSRCRITGLRPTYGWVSRYGAMALSWSMDKIGPMCRSVEDCALVMNAIYGPDGLDPTLADYAFNWDSGKDVSSLRVGYLVPNADLDENLKPYYNNTLKHLKNMGINLNPIKLPDFPVRDISFVLGTEAAAAFDELTRSNRDNLLTRQTEQSWPNSFRASRYVPAVEYIQANRLRSILMKKMADLMETIDIYISPIRGTSNLTLTNLTGHPTVVIPNGLNADGIPCSSITFTGQLYGDAELCALAKFYQDATDFHLVHPKMNY